MTGKSGNSRPLSTKGKVSDLAAVVAVALLLIVVFVGGGLLARAHGVPFSWVFVGMMGIGMGLLQGWQLRSLFKRRMFLPYLVVWIAAETGGIVFVIARYGTLAALPSMLLIIGSGYALTIAIFGLPSQANSKKKRRGVGSG